MTHTGGVGGAAALPAKRVDGPVLQIASTDISISTTARTTKRESFCTVLVVINELQYGLKRFIKLGRRDLRNVKSEISQLVSLRHPNICTCFGLVITDEYDGVLTEYVGETALNSAIEQLPWQVRLRIASQIADAMAHLHTNRVVHNDLKSENIIIATAVGGEDVAVKLTDYGVAATKAAAQRHPGVSLEEVGSLRWTAPELIRGDVTTGNYAADIYSLGMVLVELLTGDVPYGRSTPQDVAVKLAASGTPPRIQTDFERNPDQEESIREVETLALRCTDAAADARPTAWEVSDRLRALLHMKPQTRLCSCPDGDAEL